MTEKRYDPDGEYGCVILNPSCNNFCFFCRPLELKKQTEDENKNDELKVMQNLAEFKKNRVNKIEISGCDPIESKIILPLIRHIKEMGFEFVQLSTHGRHLANEAFLKELISAGVDKLRIPFYGVTAEVHDSVTRSRGSFDDVLKGIKNVRRLAPDIIIELSCLIVDTNKDMLIDIVNFVQKNGIDSFYFSIPCIIEECYYPYMPIKDMVPYVRKVFAHVKQQDYHVVFREIPYCIFGEVSNLIINHEGPPNMGPHCQPTGKNQSQKKDWPVYRLKQKVEMCEKCAHVNQCDGFFVNDLKRFGVGNLTPIFQ